MVTRKHYWLLVTLLSVLCAGVVASFLIPAFLFSRVPSRLPVDQEAFLRAQEVISVLQQPPVINQAMVLPSYLANCHDFLRDRLQVNRDQYTLVVTGAFDPADPGFQPAVNVMNASRDASVAVQFPGGSLAELYFYNGTYESCRIGKS